MGWDPEDSHAAGMNLAWLVFMVATFIQLILIPDLVTPGISSDAILLDVIVFFVLIPIAAMFVLGLYDHWMNAGRENPLPARPPAGGVRRTWPLSSSRHTITRPA